MRRFILMVLVAVLLVTPISAIGQEHPVIQLEDNLLLYSGPGENSAWYEFLPADLVLQPTGRNFGATWVAVNYDGLEGWLPASDVAVINEGSLDDLPIVSGTVASEDALYPVDTQALRDADIDMIRIRRGMRDIWLRYERLQGFLQASCEDIPVVPAPPTITPADIAAVPELERIDRELSFVQLSLASSIEVYTALCNQGGAANEFLYLDGLTQIINAFEAFKNVRLYQNEITGLLP